MRSFKKHQLPIYTLLPSFHQFAFENRNVKSSHIAIYSFLLSTCMAQSSNPEIMISNSFMAKGTRIANWKTRNQCLLDLFEWGWLEEYIPGKNEMCAPIAVLQFNIVGVKLLHNYRTTNVEQVKHSSSTSVGNYKQKEQKEQKEHNKHKEQPQKTKSKRKIKPSCSFTDYEFFEFNVFCEQVQKRYPNKKDIDFTKLHRALSNYSDQGKKYKNWISAASTFYDRSPETYKVSLADKYRAKGFDIPEARTKHGKEMIEDALSFQENGEDIVMEWQKEFEEKEAQKAQERILRIA